MTTFLFNSHAYLVLEANRLQGEPVYLETPNGHRCGIIKRDIPGRNVFDAVSVYGYPDIDLLSPGESFENDDTLLRELFQAAKEHKLVAGFLRLGLAQDVGVSSDLAARSIRVGSSVCVDLRRDREEIFQSFRPRLRSQLRNGAEFDIAPSKDINTFHRLYSENMVRLDAHDEYFFSEQYLEDLLKIEGAGLVIAEDDQGAVAGALTISHGNALYYHLGATGDRGLTSSPLRSVIAYLCQENAHKKHDILVLGGGMGGADDSLMRFKRGFSKQTKPVSALKVIFDEKNYRNLVSGAHQNLFEGYFPHYRAPRQPEGN